MERRSDRIGSDRIGLCSVKVGISTVRDVSVFRFCFCLFVLKVSLDWVQDIFVTCVLSYMFSGAMLHH